MLKFFLFPLIGAGLGFLYYRLAGCASGTCPLTAKPIAPMLLGVIAGLAVAFG